VQSILDGLIFLWRSAISSANWSFLWCKAEFPQHLLQQSAQIAVPQSEHLATAVLPSLRQQHESNPSTSYFSSIVFKRAQHGIRL